MTLTRQRTVMTTGFTGFAALALALACQACQGPPAVPVIGSDPGAMPRNPRQIFDDMKEDRFRAAVAGLEFQARRVIVTDPLPGQDRDAAAALVDDGARLLRANKRTGALAAYSRAARTDSQLAIAWHGLGEALVTKGKTPQALAAYRTAAEVDPTYVEAHYGAAMASARLGQFDDAIAQMQRAVELDAGHAAAHERLAIWHYYLDDTVTSWQHVQAARDLGREPPSQFIAGLEAKTPDRRPAVQ